MTILERQTREMYQAWGVYMQTRPCQGGCGWMRVCRRRRPRGRWLCLECWDLSEEAERWLNRL